MLMTLNPDDVIVAGLSSLVPEAQVAPLGRRGRKINGMRRWTANL